MKQNVLNVMKTAIQSPLLIARALITGVKAFAEGGVHIAHAVRKKAYDPERLTLIIVMLIEILISAGAIILAPKLLTSNSQLYYTGAGVMWFGFVLLYALTSKDVEEGESIFEYLGNAIPLSIFSFDFVSLLIIGVIHA